MRGAAGDSVMAAVPIRAPASSRSAPGVVVVGASVAAESAPRLGSPTTSGSLMKVGFSQLAPTSG